MNLKIEYLNINQLKPYSKNAKKHPKKQVEQIVNSIREFGMCDPIGIWGKDNLIVEGHGRLLALKELGYNEIPVIRLDHLTEEQRKAYTLAHNKTNESEWDLDILDLELKEITDLDMTEFGFDIDFEEPKEIVEDEAPAVDEESEPIAKLGDIWQLGDHRLMCGDSTDFLNYKLLMDGKKADLVFTDPPYGMKKESDGVLNDNLNYDDLLEFNKKWIPHTFDMLKDNGSWYCWGIDEPLMDIYAFILKPMIKENKITFRNLLTWDKGNGQGQLSSDFRMYPVADEKCLFIQMGIQSLTLNADQYWERYEPIRSYLESEAKKVNLNNTKIKEITGYGSMYSHWFTKSQFALITKENYEKLQNYYKGKAFNKEYDDLRKEYDDLRKEYDDLRAYFDNTHDNQNNVWHFDRTSTQERELTGGHATPKPIALCSRAIKSSSRENEIVLDVFGGSGSTLIACEQLNRKCYMLELDPRYCDVIIKRWETLTGKKAVRL